MVIDNRAGSRDLYPQLQMARVKPLELGHLEFGDVHITGNGPGGCPWLVGVEYKKLPDLAQSIDNGRLVGHQLPGMLACYSDSWLLMEGIWREGRHGEVEVPKASGWRPLMYGTQRAFSAAALYGFLLTLQIKLGIKVVHTGSSQQTVRWLLALNRWWTEKEYEEHRAHLAFDQSTALSSISSPSLVRRVAKELPGIGWGRSGSVARRFGSVVEMVLADKSQWEEIEGIGPTTAQRVVKALEGGK